MISNRTRRVTSALLLTAVLTSCASDTDTDEDSPPDDTSETETDDTSEGDESDED